MFVRLGLYEFGQVIFDEVQEQCDEVDRYLINTQLKILLNQLDGDFQPVEYGGGEDTCEEEEMVSWTHSVSFILFLLINLICLPL